jgi:hypothetical protein
MAEHDLLRVISLPEQVYFCFILIFAFVLSAPFRLCILPGNFTDSYTPCVKLLTY